MVLLIGNIVLLANFFIRPPNPEHGGPRNKIIEILHFNEEQISKYDLLIQKHQSDIQAAEKNLILAKNKLYSNLDESLDSLKLNQVLENQAVIEKIHYNHFQDIKELCTPEQQRYFKKLNKIIASLFNHRMKPNRK